jgi:HAD superfamily hydrolase (TIGR01509 family)
VHRAHLVDHATGVPALLFDYDGLVVDTERTLADVIIEHVAAHGGSITYADFGHLFGSTEVDHVWDELLPTWCTGLTLADLEAHAGAVLPAINDALEPLPGVRELLAAARDAGWRTGLGTGSDRERITPRLARHGLLDLFDVIVTRADVARGKPAPDIFLEAARLLDLPPEECIVLEDSPHGCEAALAAGMRVIACPSVVTAHCSFPEGIERVSSLLDVALP